MTSYSNLLLIFEMWLTDQKRELLNKADVLSERIAKNKIRLAESSSDAERKAIGNLLSVEIQRYRDIEKMPTWPVGAEVRRKYQLGNVILSLPIASFFAAEKKPFETLGTWVESFAKLIGS